MNPVVLAAVLSHCHCLKSTLPTKEKHSLLWRWGLCGVLIRRLGLCKNCSHWSAASLFQQMFSLNMTLIIGWKTVRQDINKLLPLFSAWAKKLMLVWMQNKANLKTTRCNRHKNGFQISRRQRRLMADCVLVSQLQRGLFCLAKSNAKWEISAFSVVAVKKSKSKHKCISKTIWNFA